jgi:glycosyltransferase involved in cell wall biosynthesis
VPSVSICLPVFNGEPFLPEAIESVLSQTHKDYELLISDDGSEDSSLAIANSYARRDKRIVVWSNPENLGLFGNYNQCLKRASGRYIKLFAQDDLLAPQMLSRVLEAFSAGPDIALVSTRRVILSDQGEADRNIQQLDSTRLIAGDDVIKGCLPTFQNWVGEPSAVTFPSSLAGEGFDTSFYHIGDMEYWFRIIRGRNYVFLNEPLCSFRCHGGSATSKNVRALLIPLDALRLGKLYRQYLFEAGITEQEYVQRVLDCGAYMVRRLVREEGVTAQDSASVEISGMDRDQLLRDFRELAFLSLFYAQELRQQSEAARSELESERFAAEEQLRELLHSRTWRAARSLGLVKA